MHSSRSDSVNSLPAASSRLSISTWPRRPLMVLPWELPLSGPLIAAPCCCPADCCSAGSCMSCCGWLLAGGPVASAPLLLVVSLLAASPSGSFGAAALRLNANRLRGCRAAAAASCCSRNAARASVAWRRS